MKEKIKMADRICREIKKDPNLHWLDHSYNRCAPQFPLSEFAYVKSQLLRFRIAFWAVIATLLANIVHTMATLLYSADFRFSLLFLMLVSVVAGCAFIIMYRELIESWLKANWKTHEFADDVVQLAHRIGGSDSLSCLARDRQGLINTIPRRIASWFDGEMNSLITDVFKSSSSGSAEYRRITTNVYDLCNRFRIPCDKQLGSIYTEVEQKLMAAGKLVNSSRKAKTIRIDL